VLVCAVSASEIDANKKEKALELLENADFGLSAQVLQKFYVFSDLATSGDVQEPPARPYG